MLSHGLSSLLVAYRYQGESGCSIVVHPLQCWVFELPGGSASWTAGSVKLLRL